MENNKPKTLLGWDARQWISVILVFLVGLSGGLYIRAKFVESIVEHQCREYICENFNECAEKFEAVDADNYSSMLKDPDGWTDLGIPRKSGWVNLGTPRNSSRDNPE